LSCGYPAKKLDVRGRALADATDDAGLFKGFNRFDIGISIFLRDFCA
jgi:hypothetical protein